jgi:biopolymer transport protein ExbD
MFVEKRKKIVGEIPTASLADMAFLLLTFFLVITKVGTDKGLDLVLPPEGDVKEVPRVNLMTVAINDYGSITIDEIPRPLSQVQNVVKRRVDANDRLIVSVKTTRATPYKTFIAVLDQLKQAHAKKISVAEPEK